MEFLKNWNISFESISTSNVIDQNHGFYWIEKAKGISCTIWSEEKSGINVAEIMNSNYLDILESNKENYKIKHIENMLRIKIIKSS